MFPTHITIIKNLSVEINPIILVPLHYQYKSYFNATTSCAISLVSIGIPEAQYHHIRVKRQRLSGSSKVQDFQMHERVTMELDLYEFPVKVMYSMKTIIITIKV